MEIEDRAKPINLGQHAIELEEEEIDEVKKQQMLESIYNVSGQVGNIVISSTEIYGFTTWILSGLVTILFLIYTLVPDYCVDLGLHYLPSKYFVNAVANWIGYTLLTYQFIIIGFMLS